MRRPGWARKGQRVEGAPNPEWDEELLAASGQDGEVGRHAAGLDDLVREHGLRGGPRHVGARGAAQRGLLVQNAAVARGPQRLCAGV